MSQNTNNLRIGGYEAFFKEVSLGHTKGGSTLTIERKFTEMMVDKYGEMPIDKVLVGERAIVKVILAEPVKAILAKVLPEASYAINGTDDKLGIGRTAGYKLSTGAGLLRLHPVRLAGSDRSEDIYLFLAASSGESVELPFKVDEQTVFESTFEALVDETQPEGQVLGRIGDPDIS